MRQQDIDKMVVRITTVLKDVQLYPTFIDLSASQKGLGAALPRSIISSQIVVGPGISLHNMGSIWSSDGFGVGLSPNSFHLAIRFS
jgi:hypothetical protein